MPESRNRPGHRFQPKADIPAKQRVKGRLLWTILFAVFGWLISYFVAADRYVVLFLMAAVGAVIGYLAGKKMEKDAAG